MLLGAILAQVPSFAVWANTVIWLTLGALIIGCWLLTEETDG
jgi:hypothetical protein